MTEISTPIGPLAISPKSLDGSDLALWLIGILVVVIALVVWKLWTLSEARAAACKAESEAARAEAKAVREQNERLYQQAIEATAARERALAEVVERNTASWNAHAETIKTHFGSDYYRAIRDERARHNKPH